MNNISLLEVIPGPVGKKPLLLELPVSPEAHPYLVTSSKSVVWVDRARAPGLIRTALRTVSPDQLFREILQRLQERSETDQWGSIFKVGAEAAALARLIEYGFDEVELLVSPSYQSDSTPDDMPVILADWLPPGYAIMIPVDRAFVGTVIDFGGGLISAVVHNPSRGISVIVPS